MKKNFLKRKIKKKNLTPANNRKKVGIIFFAVAIGVFLLFIARFSTIIVTGKVSGVSLGKKTQQLYQGSSEVVAKRGTIYDRNGNIIAEDASSYSIYAILDKTYKYGDEDLYAKEKNFSTIADILNSYLGIDKAKALEILQTKTNDKGQAVSQVEFGSSGSNISLDTKNQIEAAMKKKNIKGLYFTEHPDRIYPNGNFASYLIGYADLADEKDESKGLVGMMGIEQAYNDVLSGTNGRVTYRKDSKNNAIPGTTKVQKKAKDGSDVYTTLDIDLQLYLEGLMDTLQTTYEPEDVTAMLVEADTGNILAASQRPSFDPETKEGLQGENALWRNLLVEDPFEPGSTIKVFTVAAAIEAGVFSANTTYQAGSIKLYDTTINDAVNHGTLTYEQALIASSNVGMVKLEQMMGADTWNSYLEKFGLTKSTGSGLPAEQTGTIQNSSPVDTAMTAYGQAISVTNFQMIQGFTAIANEGAMLKPQYISKVVTANGKVKKTSTETISQPIQASTANQVLSYMKEVVEDPLGTGYGIYNIDGYSVGANTGTAQIAGDSGYLTGSHDYIYSVVQMVPADDPKYIMYVTVKQPKTYERTMIANLSNAMLKRALDLEDSNTDTTSDSSADKIKLSNLVGQSVTDAQTYATNAGLDLIVVGSGSTVSKQSNEEGETLSKNQKVIVATDGQLTMPDITGWSKNDVLKLCDTTGLKATFDGTGYVGSQSIAAGDVITSGTEITVTLKEE